MHDTIQSIALALIIVGAIAGTILSVSFMIYDSYSQSRAQQKELFAACLASGGSWVPQYGNAMCITPGASVDFKR